MTTCRCGSAATQHLCKPCNDQLDSALTLAVVQQNYASVVIGGIEVFVHPCDAVDLEHVARKAAWFDIILGPYVKEEPGRVYPELPVLEFE